MNGLETRGKGETLTIERLRNSGDDRKCELSIRRTIGNSLHMNCGKPSEGEEGSKRKERKFGRSRETQMRFQEHRKEVFVRNHQRMPSPADSMVVVVAKS